MVSVKLYAVTDTGPKVIAVRPPSTSIHDLFDDLPTGVYTSLCTFEHHKFLCLDDHLNRLEQSMKLLGWTYPLNHSSLRSALHQVCVDYEYTNARVRIDVLVRPISLQDLNSRVLIALSPFDLPSERIYLEGVEVGTTRELHRSRPLAKEAEFVRKRRKVLEEDQTKYECLLLDDGGYILEGTTSNFYGVRDGVLLTAGTEVLEGVARKIVLKMASKLGIPVSFEALHIGDVPTLNEAALSSSSRAIVPIIKIDDHRVGNGKPGPVVKDILKAYRAYAAEALKPAN